MKTTKLKLDMDALQVASFATQPAAADAQGTVAAHGTDPVVIGITTGLLVSYALCTYTNNN